MEVKTTDKKVLIVTYYWPPSGGAGVQRWLKISKYMREFGWEPIIYTPENPEYPVIDYSLKKDISENIKVIKHPIWEPYNFYRKLLGKKKTETVNQGFIAGKKKSSLLANLSLWTRGNFFIPDARKFWVKTSIKFLSKYLKSNPVDAVISTGPPHSMHLIALGLKNKLNLKWIADFRDPWTNIDFYGQLKLSNRADQKHKKLEAEVLNHADKVVTVSWSWAGDFKKLFNGDVNVITNGFDEADFVEPTNDLLAGFVFHHIGAMNRDRNPHLFWEALKELCDENRELKSDIKIRLTGANDYSVIESIEKNGLSQYVEKIDYMPHTDIIKVLRRSTVLLLPLNDTPNISGIIPGKLFEYLASKRPIFCIGKTNGDTAKIICETNAGIVVDFQDKEQMKFEISNLYKKFRAGTLTVQSSKLEQFTRRGAAK